ncbi:MAG: hypothetical protein IPP15_24070 [Saprospiraceae bacterium]|uniref:Uncharacterized protein n=1 Tax=Candidatus Opimibacter skivensis TaxID=2982028 RepID=A0A9D7T067_9BACT|nr:hypothetical protein [Candidatus Opimibacter skivensis]
MTKFGLRKIESIHAKQQFDQLEIDGFGILDLFEKKLKGTTYQNEFKVMLTYMEYLGNGGLLPETKFKNITPVKESVNEYEFKSKHLRVYAIQKTGGKIIVLGGFKNSQKRDIISFRAIKKAYLISLKY